MSVGGVGGRGDGFIPRRSGRLRNKEPQVTKKVASKKRTERTEPSAGQPLAGRVKPLPEEKAGASKAARVGRKGKNQPEHAGRPPLLVQWLQGAKKAAVETINYLYHRTPSIPRPIQTTAIVAGSFYAMRQGHIQPIAIVGLAGIEAARNLAHLLPKNEPEAKNANQ